MLPMGVAKKCMTINTVTDDFVVFFFGGGEHARALVEVMLLTHVLYRWSYICVVRARESHHNFNIMFIVSSNCKSSVSYAHAPTNLN